MEGIIIQSLVTVVCAVIASSGFWAWLQTKDNKKDLQSQMLVGLAHDRIIELGMFYIERGDWITQDEYENLSEYLYKPYANMGGNGSAKRVMEEVQKLRVCKEPPKEKEKGGNDNEIETV